MNFTENLQKIFERHIRVTNNLMCTVSCNILANVQNFASVNSDDIIRSDGCGICVRSISHWKCFRMACFVFACRKRAFLNFVYWLGRKIENIDKKFDSLWKIKSQSSYLIINIGCLPSGEFFFFHNISHSNYL